MSDRTKYAYDTEFVENGKTIELISIGIVCADGREYYAVNSEAPWNTIKNDGWLCSNVVSTLPLVGDDLRKPSTLTGFRWSFAIDKTSTLVKPKWVIANEVREFLHSADQPELWADYAAYDHVALCQLWGSMIHLPAGIPMWTHDLQQALELSPDFVPPEQIEGQHNALEDARHVMRVLKAREVHLHE
ncbi:3'-5' exoribonuclease [Nocardia sp. NPDC004860]|uniref:3'-5' exoribonuclease domain-containing protein n=1 Tax=Nocardia sp. NPDC004860 TaxID=3154557 RepID=UPI0033B841F1